jgi:adenylosuccinate synthase
MDEFNSIEVCIDYKDDQPVYKTFEGWKSSTEGITEFENLPFNAQEYINFIEDFVGCNISIVSTGPSRDQTIHR